MSDLPAAPDTFAAFLAGAGATGALMAARDWSGSALGPIGSWAAGLRTALGLVLKSPVPMVMLWGADGIMLYNDAYSVFAGNRHPRLLGTGVLEGWPEVADFNAHVMATVMAGGTLAYRNQALTLYRDGEPEERYFDLDYSPVPDASGRVAGVIALVVETTARVEAERLRAFRLELHEQLHKLVEPRAILDAAVTALGRHLGADRVGYTQVQRDDQTIVCESCHADGVEPLQGTFHLDSFGVQIIARQRRGLTVACADVMAEPGLEQETWRALHTRAFVSVPLVRGGRLQATLYVNACRPRRWSEQEVALIEDVANRTWDAVTRAMAEQASRESEARFRALAELSPDAILINLDDRFVYANAAAAALYGVNSAEDLIGRAPYEFLVPDHHQRVRERTQRLLAGERLEPLETMIVRHDGTHVPVEVSAGPLSWDGLPAVEVLMRDASERKAAEAVLRGSEERLRLALEAGRLAEATVHLSGDEVSVTHSPAFAALLGHPPDKHLSPEEIKAQYHPEDIDRVLAERLALIESGGEYYESQHRMVLPDGRVRWFYGRGRVSRYGDGRPRSITAVYLDETERKANELALRQLNETLEQQVIERTAQLQANQARLRAAFETSYAFQGMILPDGTLVDANRTSLASIGCTREQVINRPFWETPWFSRTPGMADALRAAIEQVGRGAQFRKEICINLPDGWRWFDFSLRPIRDAGGEVLGIVPEAVETTERRQAEEALRQSQKLEAMGQLTGGVAHDFNNLLTPILGGLDILHRGRLGGPREQRLIDGALQSAERARTLVHRLLAFSRRQPLQPTAVDMAQLINGMADLIDSTLGPQIRVAVTVQADLPAARADPNQLEMALLNLAVNARDAMVQGGTLQIDATVREVAPGHRSRLPPANYLCLAVVDNGVGMDQATVARAIEPFFSTKGIGKGTGLGLSMVHGLASQLGGALTLSSQPEVGTRVELWLPLSNEPAVSPDTSAPSAPPIATGTVLLVDDEDLVRASSADMLAELGYTVVEAHSAEVALKLVDGGLRPDVLVTDHLMPGMSGTELIDTLRRRRPELPVLLVSGYAEAEGLAAGLPCLTKPFRNVDLAASLVALGAPRNRWVPAAMGG